MSENFATSQSAVAVQPAGRIARRFRALAEAGEMGLVTYLTAGDPSLAASEKIVLAAANAGADVIELGVPFSDPVADGPGEICRCGGSGWRRRRTGDGPDARRGNGVPRDDAGARAGYDFSRCAHFHGCAAGTDRRRVQRISLCDFACRRYRGA